MTTFHDQLLSTAREYAARPSLIEGERSWTWQELVAEVDVVAAALIARGLRRGDKIAIWLPNVAEWTTLWLAAASIGCCVVPLNTRYKPAEVAYVVRQSESVMLITLDTMLGIDFRIMVAELVGEAAAESGQVDSPDFPMLRSVIYFGEFAEGTSASFAAFRSEAAKVAESELAHRRQNVVHEDDVVLVYTSGTTGFPKGARHDHTKLSDVAAMADLMGVNASDRILAHMPNFHVGGSFLSVVTSLITGAAQVCVPVFDPGTALDLIERHRCTVINGVPSHFIMMLTQLEQRARDLSSARIGWIAGAMIPQEVVTGVRRQFGMELLTMYGMTETTGVTTATRPGEPLEIVLQTVGTPIGPDYEVRVMDPDTGTSKPTGEQGEIWVRGHRVTTGYYKMLEATAEAFGVDGWFRTGDLGRIRPEDGRLQITGRLKDMFIVGGTNTYPAEIEAVIFQLNEVEQVYVVGVPDERLGEVGMAFIQLKPGARLNPEDVIAHCAERLANYKRPRHIEFVDAVPMTATGKVQKYKLRDAAIKALRLEAIAASRLLDYAASSSHDSFAK